MSALDDAAAVAAAKKKRQESFERSLAGPSVGKAGLVRDQTEINRVIAEASKGSKYYNNQVRKDRELTEKIEWYRAKRDELLASAQLDRLEAEADRILLEVEGSRDLSQTIVHVDMDAFYAAVETKRDPSLKGKPFGVGQGVLTTASYEARKYGCRSGMAGFIAKKLCPQIILVPLHFELYTEASRSVREVLREYDENLMLAGLDEGYLNITSYMSSHNMSAGEVVAQLRAEVESKTGMTMSAGIAPNRMLAKICSDQNKPNGQFEIEFERAAITRFMRDLPVRKIPGFGRVTERCLEGLGVETCGDIFTKRAELMVMQHWFGFRGLCKAYLGIADNQVQPHKREERKSVGVERTFRDKTQDEEILEQLEEIAEELEKDLANLKYAGRTVTVKFKLHTYESKTRAFSAKKYLTTKNEILPIAVDLIRKELPLRVRLLGIRMTNLKDLTLPETSGIMGYLAQPRQGSASRQHSPSTDDKSPEGSEAERPSRPPSMEIDPNPRLGGPVCPVCNSALDPDTSNAELNEHIDLCLNGEFIEEARPSPPRKRSSSESLPPGSKKSRTSARKGRPESGSILGWLRRG